MSENTLASLRDLLAQLYPDEASARRIVADAGIDPAKIAFTSHATNNWYAILNEARNVGRDNVLLDIVLREYGNNTKLQKAVTAYRDPQQIEIIDEKAQDQWKEVLERYVRRRDILEILLMLIVGLALVIFIGISVFPLLVDVIYGHIEINQFRLSTSPAYYRLDATIQNSTSYDALVNSIALSAEFLGGCPASTGGDFADEEYVFSNTVTISGTQNFLQILGAIKERNSPFSYPLTGSYWTVCSSEYAHIKFDTALLLPAKQYSSFNILIPKSMTTKRLSTSTSPIYRNDTVILDNAFNLLAQYSTLEIVLSSGNEIITKTLETMQPIPTPP